MRTWHYRNTVRKHVGILAYQLVDARLNGNKGNRRPHRPCLWAMRNQVPSVVSPIVGGRGSMIRRIYPELSRLLAWPKRMFPRVSRVGSGSQCKRLRTEFLHKAKLGEAFEGFHGLRCSFSVLLICGPQDLGELSEVWMEKKKAGRFLLSAVMSCSCCLGSCKRWDCLG